VVSLNLRLNSQSIEAPEGVSFSRGFPFGVTKTTTAYYITYVPSADLCQYSRNLGKAQRIELFHANDFLRPWRTFCVNYGARTSTDPPRQMAKRRLKNYKLKHGRLLTCYSGLLYLLAIYSSKETVDSLDVVAMTRLTPPQRPESHSEMLEEATPENRAALRDFLKPEATKWAVRSWCSG
jgi:hypothetical protein